MTYDPHFRVMIYYSMSNNSTNGKSYMIYRVVPFPMTFSDYNLDSKVTAIVVYAMHG